MADRKDTAQRNRDWGSDLLFLRKFLRHGSKIASFWPSSRALARATVAKVDFAGAKVIVELGAGTGPITAAVAERLGTGTRFVAVERDADFARVLRQRFAGRTNIEIVEADAREVGAILKARGILAQEVDYILSGLPTPSLPAGVRRRIFASVRKYLAPEGVYSALTEIPFVYWGLYKAVFREVEFRFVVANMPPSGVYHCSGPR